MFEPNLFLQAKYILAMVAVLAPVSPQKEMAFIFEMDPRSLE